MRLPNSLATLTVYEFLCSPATAMLTMEERCELECVPEHWTMRKAWPSLARPLRNAVRSAHKYDGDIHAALASISARY